MMTEHQVSNRFITSMLMIRQEKYMKWKYKLGMMLAIIIVPFIILNYAVDNFTHNMNFINLNKYNFVFTESEDYYFGGVIDDPQIAYEINEVLHTMKSVRRLSSVDAEEILLKNPIPKLDCYSKICFYDEMYRDMYSLKYFTAENYQEVLQQVSEILMEHEDYFRSQGPGYVPLN